MGAAAGQGSDGGLSIPYEPGDRDVYALLSLCWVSIGACIPAGLVGEVGSQILFVFAPYMGASWVFIE